jgi:hypothetical protein
MTVLDALRGAAVITGCAVLGLLLSALLLRFLFHLSVAVRGWLARRRTKAWLNESVPLKRRS